MVPALPEVDVLLDDRRRIRGRVDRDGDGRRRRILPHPLGRRRRSALCLLDGLLLGGLARGLLRPGLGLGALLRLCRLLGGRFLSHMRALMSYLALQSQAAGIYFDIVMAGPDPAAVDTVIW